VAAGRRAHSSLSSDEAEKVSLHEGRDVEQGMKKRSRGTWKGLGFRTGMAQPGDERACKTCGREVRRFCVLLLLSCYAENFL